MGWVDKPLHTVVVKNDTSVVLTGLSQVWQTNRQTALQ